MLVPKESNLVSLLEDGVNNNSSPNNKCLILLFISPDYLGASPEWGFHVSTNNICKDILHSTVPVGT